MKFFVYSVVAVVALAVIAGVVLVGSPGNERDRQFDQRRVNDLQNIQSQVVNSWQRKGELPPSLAALTDPVGGFIQPTDPVTGASYEYATSGLQSFSLCATFAQPSSPKNNLAVPAVVLPRGSVENWNWDHGVGRVCFERTIDPAIYPPVTPGKAADGCKVTGCSSQVCSDTDQVTTCEWTPAYACYGKYSVCERQATGRCGWTPTAALTQCLSTSGPVPAPVE